jgi:hypothetical protein
VPQSGEAQGLYQVGIHAVAVTEQGGLEACREGGVSPIVDSPAVQPTSWCRRFSEL